MHSPWNAIAFASALTAIFAFRYRARLWVLAAYFAGFAGLEYGAQGLVLPRGALPPETAYVLFFIAALFVIAGRIQRRLAPEE